MGVFRDRRECVPHALVCHHIALRDDTSLSAGVIGLQELRASPILSAVLSVDHHVVDAVRAELGAGDQRCKQAILFVRQRAVAVDRDAWAMHGQRVVLLLSSG